MTLTAPYPEDAPDLYDLVIIDKTQLAGVMEPASIVLSPKHEFDEQSPASMDGAFVFYKGYKVARFSFTMRFSSRTGWKRYLENLQVLELRPGKKNAPKARVVSNGWFAVRKVAAVNIEEITTPVMDPESRQFTYKVSGLEFHKPPKTSSAGAITETSPGNAFRPAPAGAQIRPGLYVPIPPSQTTLKAKR